MTPLSILLPFGYEHHLKSLFRVTQFWADRELFFINEMKIRSYCTKMRTDRIISHWFCINVFWMRKGQGLLSYFRIIGSNYSRSFGSLMISFTKIITSCIVERVFPEFIKVQCLSYSDVSCWLRKNFKNRLAFLWRISWLNPICL